MAIAWPLYGDFAHYYFTSVADHAESLMVAPVVVAELIGLALIGWDYARRKA